MFSFQITLLFQSSTSAVVKTNCLLCQRVFAGMKHYQEEILLEDWVCSKLVYSLGHIEGMWIQFCLLDTKTIVSLSKSGKSTSWLMCFHFLVDCFYCFCYKLRVLKIRNLMSSSQSKNIPFLMELDRELKTHWMISFFLPSVEMGRLHWGGNKRPDELLELIPDGQNMMSRELPTARRWYS